MTIEFLPTNYACVYSLLQLTNNLQECTIECQINELGPHNQIFGVNFCHQYINKIQIICQSLGFLWSNKTIIWSILPHLDNTKKSGLELGLLISYLISSEQFKPINTNMRYFGDLNLNGNIFCQENSLEMISELDNNIQITTNFNSSYNNKKYQPNFINAVSIFEIITK